MKKLLIFVQILFACIFLVAFVSSFFVVDIVKEKARHAITEKVVASTTSKVALAEELLNTKAANRYLQDYQIDVIKDELATFKADPNAYVQAMTMSNTDIPIIPPSLTSKNPLKNAFFEKIFFWKKDLKSYFNKSFSALINDIRTFLVINAVALIVAAFVGLRATSLNGGLMSLSAAITLATILAVSCYVDQDWLFSILLNSYMGYGYASGIIFLTAYLYFEYYKNHMDKTPFKLS